jgi:hypothetical protein
VTASTAGPEFLKLVGDLLDTIRHQAGKTQVAKRVEEGELLIGQFYHHRGTPFYRSSGIVSEYPL